MDLKQYHPLAEMERIPAEEMTGKFEEICDRIDKEDIGFVITKDGKDSYVLCPYDWFEPEYETVAVEVDAVVFAQLKEILDPLGVTPEELAVRFYKWLVNPETQEEAIAWLLKAKGEQENP